MKRQIIFLFAIIFIALNASARQPERGYRGFLDWSNCIRTEKVPGFIKRYTDYYTGFSTSHGFQFNPWLYIGAGIDFEYNSDQRDRLLTPFIHGRTDLLFGKFTPFGEIRLGYNLTNGGGVYFSPNIGYRFNWGRKMGINLGLGATIIGYSADLYDVNITPDGEYIFTGPIGKRHGCTGYFSFRIGIDF